MKRLCILLIAPILILTACSRNELERPSYSQPKAEIHTFEIPAWLLEMPEGDFSIGISYAEPPTSAQSQDYGKDFAAIALSRNHSSYIVDKYSVMSLAAQTDDNYRAASFNLVVSQDLDYLRSAAQNLKKISSFNSNGYWLSVYGFEDVALDSSMVCCDNTEVTPAWARSSGVSLDNGTIYSVGSSRQATLMDAFNASHEMALRSVGQHLVRNVVDIMRTENDLMQRSSAFETVIQSPSLCFDKVWIRRYVIDGSSSFEVFIRIKERKTD